MRMDVKIQHPEWLSVSKPESSITLFKRGLLPSNIAGWMIVVGLKHPLRAVYGSDLRAALALLWQALTQDFHYKWLAWKYRHDGKRVEK